MIVEIFNRWTFKLQLSVEIDASFESSSRAVQLGAATAKAYADDADLRGADLRGASLSGADLRGADLRGASLSGADLSGADLRDASLSGADLSGADLRDASLRGADLSDASLRGADLSGADLSGADLSGADLRALLKEIKVDSLNRKILASVNAGGIFDMSAWHGNGGACGTTHCRAGWAIHHAGSAGRVLESCYGTPVAATLIHLASCPQLAGKTPDFYATDEEALEDIKRLAAMEPEITV